MSENSLTSGAVAKRARTDLDDLDLFADALDRLDDDGGPASDTGMDADGRPRLTLVQPDDDDPALAADDTAPSPNEDVTISDDIDDRLVDPDEDGELWLHSPGTEPGASNTGFESSTDANDAPAHDGTMSCESTCSAESPALKAPAAAMPAISESFELDEAIEAPDADDEFMGHDHSAVEDVVLSNPLMDQLVAATIAPIHALTPDSAEETALAEPVAAVQSAAALGLPGSVPQRIGSGKLAPPKYHWKPGDPFGGCEDDAARFRWEVMLTTACVTALCGLGCIWLLRTILA